MPLNLQERPIFMIGAERSGTTLVMALLGCHSRIAVPEVVWYYPRFYPYLICTPTATCPSKPTSALWPRRWSLASRLLSGG